MHVHTPLHQALEGLPPVGRQTVAGTAAAPHRASCMRPPANQTGSSFCGTTLIRAKLPDPSTQDDQYQLNVCWLQATSRRETLSLGHHYGSEQYQGRHKLPIVGDLEPVPCCHMAEAPCRQRLCLDEPAVALPVGHPQGQHTPLLQLTCGASLPCNSACRD